MVIDPMFHRTQFQFAGLRHESHSVKWFSKGFTLAELLIALAILGEIAAFTIPKIISSQRNGQYNSAAKEVSATLSAAYQQLKLNTGVSSATKPADLMPYINYVTLTTTGSIDHVQTTGTFSCSSSYPCYKLHNGGILLFDGTGGGGLGGTSSTHAMRFIFDPDGRDTDGTTNGPGKGVGLLLFYNGRFSTYGEITFTTANAGGDMVTSPAHNPPWFSW